MQVNNLVNLEGFARCRRVIIVVAICLRHSAARVTTGCRRLERDLVACKRKSFAAGFVMRHSGKKQKL